MLPVHESMQVRAIVQADFAQWKPLWDGYNAFYGRAGACALPESITQITWQRFFDEQEPVFAFVAETGSGLLGLAHYLFHRSTTRVEPVCYLQDLFTAPSARGRGVGRALIQGVYSQAQAYGARRVYWQTQESNQTARALYDQVAKHHGFIVYTKDF
jgi:GNAT superfamily N-acetyltransferase